MWEGAIRICKTLIHEYEMEVFDFIKLSEMLVRRTHSYMLYQYINRSTCIIVYIYILYFSSNLTSFFLQQLQAKFYENIITTHRLEPSFFRVGFYGMAFPSFLQVSVSPPPPLQYLLSVKI